MQESILDSQSLMGILENKLPISNVKRVDMLADCIESISSGNPILLYEGENDGFSLGLAKWEKRGIEEPAAEGGVRGPREGFNESLQVNTSQLRRIIKSPALKNAIHENRKVILGQLSYSLISMDSWIKH